MTRFRITCVNLRDKTNAKRKNTGVKNSMEILTHFFPSELGSYKRKNKKTHVCHLCERQMQAQMQGGAYSSAI